MVNKGAVKGALHTEAPVEPSYAPLDGRGELFRDSKSAVPEQKVKD